MKYNYSIYLFIILIATSCSYKKNFNSKIRSKHAPQDLKNDLQIIKYSLEQAHPGVYWYISKENLDFKFDSVKNLITDSMSSINFYRMVAPVVSAVKCGHTRLVYPGIKLNKQQQDSIKKIGKVPLAQLDYQIEDKKLYIKKLLVKGLDSLKPGQEILSIDGISSANIINQTQRLFGSDGYNQTFYNEVLNRSFASYYYLAIPRKDSSILVIKNKEQQFQFVLKSIKPEKKVKTEELSKEEKYKNEVLAKENKIKLRKNRYKGLDADKKPILNYKIDSTVNSTAVLTVKSFSFNNSNFRRFFRETFKDIQDKNIQNVILDLRDNGGGSLSSCHLLFRYLYNQTHQYTGKAYIKNLNFEFSKYIDKPKFLKVIQKVFYPSFWLVNKSLTKKDSIGKFIYIYTAKDIKPKKHVFNHNLLILINGLSFSATSLLSANLQQVNRGTFIGEETGGGYNKCTAGTIPYLLLPETKLKLRLPLKVIQISKQRNLSGRGVFPDDEIKENIPDVVNKKDTIYEKAIELLKRK